VKFLHENKLLVVFVACGALLIAALGGGFYLQYLNDAAEASRHATTRRLVALEETLTSLQDVRIHHAGLLITGKPLYRQQFDQSRQQLDSKLAALHRLYPPDEHSDRVLRELKRLYALKVAELRRPPKCSTPTGSRRRARSSCRGRPTTMAWRSAC
jgi:CHASE3 domain sensor protein